MRDTILFINYGKFSNINSNLIFHFQKIFSECVIEEFDVIETIANKYLHSPKNILFLIKEYGIDFLTLQKSRYSIWDWGFVTSYMFKIINEKIREHTKKKKYIFSFQTRSMFDGSSPDIPHFVYTDSTVLSLLYYKNISYRSVFKSRAWMKLEPQIYHNATINFTFSSNQAKSLIEQYNIDIPKVKCVYAGSNIQSSLEIGIEKHYNNKTILFVGVNWQRKGGPILIKAFKKVLNKHDDANLIIVGCNENEIVSSTIEKDLLNVKCHIKGKVPIEKVKQYYLEASIFCLPTRIEPFGIAFIEAMMYRLPLVVSNIGALPDLVDNGINGFMHNPNDVDGFADSLIYLLDNPLRCKEMGLAGYNKAMQSYTWENTVSLMKKYIDETIK